MLFVFCAWNLCYHEFFTRADISTGLVAHYTFDGNTNDSSGNNNHGTAVGNPTYVTGQIGQALSFDGTDDDVEMGDPADGSLDFGTGNFSISTWIKQDPVQVNDGGLGVVWKGANTSPDAGYNLFYEADLDKVTCGVSDTGTRVITVSNTTISDDVLVHVVTVTNRDNDTCNIYLNGVLDKSGDISAVTGSVDNTNAFRVGANAFTGSGEFTGDIDDVRIYNRALTAADITELYNLGATGEEHIKVRGGGSSAAGVKVR